MNPRILASSFPWRPLLLLTAAAAALRFPGLGDSSFWLDEAFEAAAAAAPLDGAIFYETNHPPLHRFLLALWLRAFGESDAALRAFPALIGTLSVPALFGLADRALGRRTAWIAAGLGAVSPYFVEYSREVRGYALLILLTTLCCHAFLAWTRDDRSRARVAWATTALLGLHTHYFFVFVLLAQAVDVALRPDRRARLRQALVPVAAVFLVTLPWAIHAALHLAPQDRSYVLTPIGNVATTLFRFATGYGLFVLDSRVATLPIGEQILRALPAAIVAAVVFGPLLFVGLRAGWRDRARGGRLLVLLLALPPLVLVAVSPILPLLHDRYLAFAAPAFLVLVASGIAALPRRAAIVAGVLVAVVSLVSDGRTLLDPRCRKEEWRGAAAIVREHARPGDVVVVEPEYLRFAFDRYDRSDLPRVAGSDARELPTGPAGRRTWLVTRLHDPAGGDLGDLLDRRLRRRREWIFPTHWGIRVALYERPAHEDDR